MEKKDEVIFIGDNSVIVDPSTFKKEELSLDEFVEKFKEYPSIAMEAHQRTVAAMKMFGKTELSKGRWRWNFLDDPVVLPGKKAGAECLYGIEPWVNDIVKHLEEATQNPTKRSRFIMLLGPPSSGKTQFIKLLSYTLDAFGSMPEGAKYIAKFDLSEFDTNFLKKHFGGLTEFVCPNHEIPLNYLGLTELNNLLEEVNKNLPHWQRINPNNMKCPTCKNILPLIKEAGAELKDVLKIMRIYVDDPNGHSLRMAEFRPAGEKDFDSKQVFGGSFNFKRLGALKAEDHPLVLNYGIGGLHDGPSPQGHIVHISEMYKAPKQDFLNPVLDLIQNRTLQIKGVYTVPIDCVFFATSNLKEHKDVAEDEALGDYLTSRSKTVQVPWITVRTNLEKALTKTVFNKKNTLGVHIPGHFERQVIAALGVLSTLEEPESDFKVNLLQKMDLYDDRVPPGLEGDYEVLKRELERKATDKTASEIVEGVRIGIPFRFYQDLMTPFRTELERREHNISEELKDERYPGGCLAHIGDIYEVMVSVIKKNDSINIETKKRILEGDDEAQIPPLLSIVMELWMNELAKDANTALMGEEVLKLEGARYLAMLFADANGRQRYESPETRQEQFIDRAFLRKFDQLSGVKNPTEFRDHYTNAYRFRMKDAKDVMVLSEQLLQEDPRFRDVIERYVINEILPKTIDNVSTAYSPKNTKLVDSLLNMKNQCGEPKYCKGCVNLVISAASYLRSVKEGDASTCGSDGIGHLFGGGCGRCKS